MLIELQERYTDIIEISRGSTSIVYSAKNKITGEKVAIKEFIYATFDSEGCDLSFVEQFKRFKREIEIHLSLSHENIIQAREYYESDSKLYLILDYHPSRTLQSILESRIHLDIFEIINIVRQIAEALNYMENRGIVHRDIKPGNILITDDKKAFIIDFGCAKKIYTENLTISRMLIGTVNYMSPEQLICHKEIDGRADIFSLGCTFYYMLTQQLPFRGEDIRHTINNIFQTHPTQIRNINNSVPYKLESLVHHMLKKDPDHRCSTARQLIFHLNKILDEPEIHYNQGKYYEAKNDFKKAYILYKRAIQADDNYLPAWQSMADLYYLAKDWDKAFEFYSYILNFDSSNHVLYSKLGDVYNGLGKYSESLKMYQKAWFFESENLDYYLKIASALYLCNKVSESIESYLSIIERNPESFNAIYELGIIYYKTGKYSKACQYLERSLELKAFNNDALVCLGALYQEMGEFDKSIEMYSILERLNPDSALSLHNLACAYYQNGDLENAEKKLDKLIKYGLAGSQSYILLGLIHENTNKYDIALENYKKSIEIEPLNLSSYLYLSNCMRSQWRISESIDILKDALKVETKYSKAEVYYQLAELFLETGQYEESKKYYKECMERTSGELHDAAKKQLKMLNGTERKVNRFFRLRNISG